MIRRDIGAGDVHFGTEELFLVKSKDRKKKNILGLELYLYHIFNVIINKNTVLKWVNPNVRNT